MTITSHGHWTRYTPDVLPDAAPENAVFWRRAADGADWYAWSRSHWQIIGGEDRSGTIKLSVVDGTVSCVGTDATSLTLANVFDLYEVVGDTPPPALGWRTTDGASFSPPAPAETSQEPTADRIRAALKATGKTDEQVDALFLLAAAL